MISLQLTSTKAAMQSSVSYTPFLLSLKRGRSFDGQLGFINRHYSICRAYGTCTALLPSFWRYRHIVPTGTGDVVAASHRQALSLKGPGQSVISMRRVCTLCTKAAMPTPSPHQFVTNDISRFHLLVVN